MTYELNRYDRQILQILQTRGRISNQELADAINLSPSPCLRRVRQLEENGLIKVHKGFIGRKTNTTYSITKTGEKSFTSHISALEKMIKGMR